MKKTLPIIIILIVALGILALMPTNTTNEQRVATEEAIQPATENESQNPASPQPNIQQEKFEGTITAYDTGCFADAVCSVTVGDRKVILVTGSRMLGEEQVGKLLGVPDIGSLEKKIGSRAEVFARKLPSGEYTLYGNTAYYVRVK